MPIFSKGIRPGRMPPEATDCWAWDTQTCCLVMSSIFMEAVVRLSQVCGCIRRLWPGQAFRPELTGALGSILCADQIERDTHNEDANHNFAAKSIVVHPF